MRHGQLTTGSSDCRCSNMSPVHTQSESPCGMSVGLNDFAATAHSLLQCQQHNHSCQHSHHDDGNVYANFPSSVMPSLSTSSM